MFRHRRKSKEEELERELRSDLELEAEERRENGLSAKEARYAAQRASGQYNFEGRLDSIKRFGTE